MAKLTKDEETQLLKDSVHKYIMSEEEFNVVEKILSSSHMDQVFDVTQIDNNDMFKDFEEDKVVPLQTGLGWLWDGLVEPTVDELTQDEKKTLSELLNKFDVLHGKKLNENLEVISSENTLFADSYTNEILNKIRAAGIEVVTDKKQFDEILESEDILQKMSNDEIIKNMAKQRDDAIEEKNRINAKKLEDFKAEVKSYAPLIKELIKTGNTLLENGFDLEGWKGHTGHYSDGSFYADGWTHKFGFKSSNGKIVAVGRSLGDDGEKYYIYSDGENIDIGPYTFKYDHDYDWEPKGWLDGIQKFKTTLSEKFNLNFDNIKRNEKKRTELKSSNKIELKTQIVNISNEEKQLLSEALKETAEEFVSVVYSRENYNKIFGEGIIESPIETIKLGSNQFIKLSPGNRNNFLYAIRQTLETPSIILEKETWDDNSESFKPVHLYGKSFINDNNSEKLVESLIIFKEGNNIAVSLHPNGIDKFVEQIKTTNDIIYLDDEVSRVVVFAISDGDSHVVKENEIFLSRVRQVSYSSLRQESYPLINKKYNSDSLLSSKEFISTKGIEIGKLEINKDNFDRYFNILNQHKNFKDNRNKIASELFNFHVSSEKKESMKQWLSEQGYVIKEKEATQYMTNNNGLTYGFVHNGKIYLNPVLMNSNATVHEYTHLWDAYTQKTNPELWNKGLKIFKDTKYWNEVISDPNYQDIKDDENLVLSEIHSRICGDIAEKVLERIAELDGEQVKLDAIDWDKKTWEYIAFELNVIVGTDIAKDVHDFLSTPMKDLIASKDINISKIHELNENKEEITMKNSENNTQNNNVNDPINVFKAYNLPKELDDSYSHSEFTKALREAIEKQLPSYSDDKNADNYAVSALLNPIMVGYANTGDEKLYKAAKETVVQYLEKYITYEYTETEELMQMKAEGTLDYVAEKELRERIEYDSRSIVDNYITSSEWRPEEQLKYSTDKTLENFRKLDWRSNFFESSTYEDTKDYKALLKAYNHFNYLRRFSDEVSKEINEREKLSSLSPEELEQKIERALQDGNAIYVNGKDTPDRYHYGLRITPNKGKYSMYGYVIGQSNPAKRIEKLKEYKISNEIREGIKNKNVLEVLSKHGLSVHGIEDSHHQDLRLFNDKIDKFIKEDLITSFKDGFYSKDKVESLTSKLTNSSLPEDLTYRDLYNELSKDKCYRLDEKGPELFNLLKTDDKEIIGEIKDRMNDIWRGRGNLFLRIPHAHPDYGERPYWNEAFDYAEEKVYKFELEEKDRKVTVDGKEYYNEEGLIYSTTLFDNDCFFNAKELDTGNKVTLYMDRNTNLGTLKKGESVIVESPESGFVATDIYKKDSDGRIHRNEHLENRISDCLKLGRFLTEREFHKERAVYIKELSSKSVFLESEIPDLNHYYPEEQKEEAQKKYEEDKAVMLQELQHKGVELPCIMFGYKEGWQDSVPELITNKIYSVKEFDQIIGEADLNRHEKYLGYDKSDVYIIDKDGDVHYERYDIGDGDGGLIARFQHQYDYQMNQGYEKYWNKESVSEEQWKKYRQADLELINTLKEAVENDVNRHLNLRENNTNRGRNTTIWDAGRYVFNKLESQADVLSLPEEYKNLYQKWFKELTKENLHPGNELLMQKIPQIVEVVQIKDGRKGIIKKYPNGFGFSEILPDNFKNPILDHVDDYSETLDEAEKKLLDYLGGHNIDGLIFNQQMVEDNLYNDVVTKSGLDEIAVFLKDVRRLNDSLLTNTAPLGQENLINSINLKWGSNFKLKDEPFGKDIITLDRWANKLYEGMELICPQIQSGISVDDNVIGSASISVDEKIKLLKEDFNVLILPASPYITPLSETQKNLFLKCLFENLGYENSASILASVGTNILDTVEEYISKNIMDGKHSKESYISSITEALVDIKNNSFNEGSHFYIKDENKELVDYLLSNKEEIENIFNFYNDSERFSLTSGWNDENWNVSSYDLIYKNIPEQYKEIVDFTKEHENESKLLKNQLFHYAFNKEYYPIRPTDLSEITSTYEVTKSLCHESESLDFVKIPFVAVNWSESDKFKSGEVFSIEEFDKLTREVDNSNYEENQGKLYNKLKFTIYMGANETYTDRMDLGDGYGGLIEFLDHYNKLEIIEKLKLSEKEPELDLLSEKYNWISNSELINYMEATGTPMSEELASSIADLFDEYNEALVIDENGNIFTRDCSDSKTDTEQDISAVTQTDIIQKTIEFIEKDLNEINPDDTIYKNKEKLLSEIQDWQEKASQSNLLEKDKPQFASFDNIPEYAVGYLAYGETDGLSEEDIKNIEDFLTKENLGDLISLDSTDRSFSSNPAFGLPADCVSATFSVLSKEQVHKKVVSEGSFEIKAEPLFSEFQFDFSKPITWHNADRTSLIYADTRITQEMAESLYKMAGMESAYNPDMAYCIQYRCLSTNKANLVYLCKVDPMAEITSPQPDVKLPDELVKRVMKGVEDDIIKHKEQHHNLPGYLYEATGIAAPERNINRHATGRKPVPVKPAVKQETSSIDFGVTSKGKLKIKAKENYTIDNSMRDKLRDIGYKYDSFSQSWTCNNTPEAQKVTLDVMKDNFPLDFENYVNNQSNKVTEAIESKKAEQPVSLDNIDNSANKLWENIRNLMDQDVKGSNSFNGKPYGAFVYLYKNANMIERRNIEKLLPPKTVRDPATGTTRPLSQDEYAKQVNNLIWTKTYPERFMQQNSPDKQVLKDKDDNNPSIS